MVDTSRCLRHVPDDPDCGASLPSSPTLNETSLTICRRIQLDGRSHLVGALGNHGLRLVHAFSGFCYTHGGDRIPSPWLLLHACSPAMR